MQIVTCILLKIYKGHLTRQKTDNTAWITLYTSLNIYNML